LIAENEKLRTKIAKIENETANKYLGIIDSLKEALEAVMQRCAEPEERVAKLEAEIDRLRKQLNNDSGNPACRQTDQSISAVTKPVRFTILPPCFSVSSAVSIVLRSCSSCV
jgi:predicted  nucleic acid-binding Zn-ribbon protein